MPVTTRDDLSIWYAVEGRERGPGLAGTGAAASPLVLIQGLGYTADLWYRVLPGLSEPRMTIRLDNRGVGRSSVPEPPWTVAEMADDVIEVLDAAGLERAHVFGVSMGGLIAQELVLRHPHRVDRLVLGATHPGGPEAVRMDPAAATMLMDRTPRPAREIIEDSLAFLYAESTTRDDIDGDVRARMRYPLRAKAYWGQLDAMRAYEGTLPRLGEVQAPTLVIHGTADRLVQPANAEVLAG
ncbi:MAG TPA: alpha/beta hydrolase, partial [Mycobacteriales bacterium]|nr:alpha/beta hydrolase [Mycobacteriales bacterium]